MHVQKMYKLMFLNFFIDFKSLKIVPIKQLIALGPQCSRKLNEQILQLS